MQLFLLWGNYSSHNSQFTSTVPYYLLILRKNFNQAWWNLTFYLFFSFFLLFFLDISSHRVIVNFYVILFNILRHGSITRSSDSILATAFPSLSRLLQKFMFWNSSCCSQLNYWFFGQMDEAKNIWRLNFTLPQRLIMFAIFEFTEVFVRFEFSCKLPFSLLLWFDS